jgi:hypothetical protein
MVDGWKRSEQIAAQANAEFRFKGGNQVWREHPFQKAKWLSCKRALELAQKLKEVCKKLPCPACEVEFIDGGYCSEYKIILEAVVEELEKGVE